MPSSAPAEPGGPLAARSGPASRFRRSENALAHAVYGLILALATVGELIHAEQSAAASVAWLLGAGVVLLAAHLFSDALAHLAATHDGLPWSQVVRLGWEDLSVTSGFVGAAGVMALTALADAEPSSGLGLCVVLGLVALAGLSFSATANHRPVIRVLMAAGAVLISVGIIAAENAV